MITNRIIFIILLLSLCVAGATAQKSTLREKFEFAPQIGFDFGAAIPVPISNVPEGKKAISPVLGVSPALRFVYKFNNQWAIGFDPAYKSIGMSIKARVTNQKFNNKGALTYFTGIADMDMSFAMFEFPLYGRFSLPNGKNRFMLGYYAGVWTYQKFQCMAQKGFIGAKPNHVESVVANGGVNMDFTQFLGTMEHGITFGYEHLFSSRFSGGVRFNMGLNDMFVADASYFDYDFLPIRVGFMLSYTIF